ncbi:hypothetical protein [Nocardia inohanensis]|uniref:hypothetical protein n=1 Tax=Nocardia inohanensis TaxID=209246 RepID=UPI00083433A6|nr:hypothetical protein [Nocardia inohanensis]
MRIRTALRATGLALAAALAVGLAATPAVAADPLDRVLDLPLVNRDAAAGPGGIHPELPYDRAELGRLLDEARGRGIPATRYAALLEQYWLVDATGQAGIDLSSWDPRAGIGANRGNLIASYRYYENLQLAHRELQWAGMAGQVGADFGGGLVDFDLGKTIYQLPGIADAARTVLGAVRDAAGEQAVTLLPRGLAALAQAGDKITPADLDYILGMILVMQKNIFTDLIPMHDAYVSGGVPAVAEFRAAGLIGDDVLGAWRDIASGDQDRIAAGNVVLLRREQQWAVGAQWDQVRGYRGPVGEAITYLSGAAGTPSVAGVRPPREFDSARMPFTAADGRAMELVLPLPDWNWSVLDERWAYITTELLPKYRDQVEHNWPALAAVMNTPYEIQLETHRPLLTAPETLLSAAQALRVTDAGGL